MARTIAEATKNLRDAAPLMRERYIQGVMAADWQGPAASPEAESNYAAGVQRAISDGSRQRGIMAVQNTDWRAITVEKGAGIIGDRVIGALEKYNRNFGPILVAMNDAVTRLPPRGPSARGNVTTRLLPIIAAAQTAAQKAVT